MGRAVGVDEQAVQQALRAASAGNPFLAFDQFSFDQFVGEHLDFELVSGQGEFERLIDSLRAQKLKRLGLDCEVADMEVIETTREYEQDGVLHVVPTKDLVGGTLRTVQLALYEPSRGIGPKQYLIDLGTPAAQQAGAGLDIARLAELLSDRSIEKQIHFADFEQEQLTRRLGTPIVGYYDTCRAWMSIQKYLRNLSPELRLEAGWGAWEKRRSTLSGLCRFALGFELPKEEQAGDWAAEHLSEAQIRYAVADAAALPLLVKRMKIVAKDLGVSKKVYSHFWKANNEVLDRLFPERIAERAERERRKAEKAAAEAASAPQAA